MEPKGVVRELGLMPAGHGNGGASPSRAAGALLSAVSIRKDQSTHHAAVADGCGKKCGKTHIFLVWERAG